MTLVQAEQAAQDKANSDKSPYLILKRKKAWADFEIAPVVGYTPQPELTALETCLPDSWRS